MKTPEQIVREVFDLHWRDMTTTHREDCEGDWGRQGQESPCNCSARSTEVPLTLGVGGKRIGSAFLGQDGLAEIEITGDEFGTHINSPVSDYSIYINDKAPSTTGQGSIIGERPIMEIANEISNPPSMKIMIYVPRETTTKAVEAIEDAFMDEGIDWDLNVSDDDR